MLAIDTAAGELLASTASGAGVQVGHVAVGGVGYVATEATPLANQLRAIAAHYASTGELDPGLGDGDFSLALVDANRRALHLATDRFGVFPIHYATTARGVAFSSHLDWLRHHEFVDHEIDAQALYEYVFFHCIPGPRTVYTGVRKLDPGETVCIREGDARTRTWWMPAFGGDGVPPEAGQGRLLELLGEAVSDRLSPDTGAFLSGGLDSSSVVGAAARLRPGFPTFTIGFEEKAYDESGYARMAADRFGTDHHEYFVSAGDLLEEIHRLAVHPGEPFGNSSVVPTYFCARHARGHGIDVLLAGDGGDELFAGNTRYQAQDVFERYFRVPASGRRLLESAYAAIPWLKRVPVASKGFSYVRQANMGLPDRLQSYNFLAMHDPSDVFDAAWLETIDREEPWRIWRERYTAPADAEPLQRMLYLDWKFTLACNDLVKVNQMCELAGVEVRYPMLDRRIVDFAASVPASDLMMGGELRGFYKAETSGFLPQEIIAKSKHGFGLPIGLWIRSNAAIKAEFEGKLRSLGRRGIFDPGFLDTAWRMQQTDSAAYYGELIWILGILEMWLAHKVDSTEQSLSHAAGC